MCSSRLRFLWVSAIVVVVSAAFACGRSASGDPAGAGDPAPTKSGSSARGATPPARGGSGDVLVVTTSEFPLVNGQPSTRPGPAKLMAMRRAGERWSMVTSIDDTDSNVFHKAMAFTVPGGPSGILTIGGNAAALKLWRREGGQWRATTLWQTTFGGTHNRLRDVEVANLDDDPEMELAIATHDQGVVAVVDFAGGQARAQEIDRAANIFVHEIEIGDVDGDRHPEIYATPSEPNRLQGGAQHGIVTRYVRREGRWVREVAADLGNRHAKEILVTDMDGDGRDELYVAVEALTTGPNGATLVEGVEIRRFVRGAEATARDVVARFDDRFMRFLAAGDVDGDGRKELVAAAFSTGLWMLRPGQGEWAKTSIDSQSGGFEHATVLVDLDGDRRVEIFAADDEHGALRRYTWADGAFQREVVAQRAVARTRLTWNLGAVPAALVE